ILAMRAQSQTPATTPPPSTPPAPTPTSAVVPSIPPAQAGPTTIPTTTIVLDTFDSVSQWTATPADGVEISVHPDSNGVHGRAMREDFDFHGRAGLRALFWTP